MGHLWDVCGCCCREGRLAVWLGVSEPLLLLHTQGGLQPSSIRSAMVSSDQSRRQLPFGSRMALSEVKGVPEQRRRSFPLWCPERTNCCSILYRPPTLAHPLSFCSSYRLLPWGFHLQASLQLLPHTLRPKKTSRELLRDPHIKPVSVFLFTGHPQPPPPQQFPSPDSEMETEEEGSLWVGVCEGCVCVWWVECACSAHICCVCLDHGVYREAVVCVCVRMYVYCALTCHLRLWGADRGIASLPTCCSLGTRYHSQPGSVTASLLPHFPFLVQWCLWSLADSCCLCPMRVTKNKWKFEQERTLEPVSKL